VLKALEYHERAGRQALQRSAYTEAMRGLMAALELIQRLPHNAERDQRELALQTSLGPVLMATKGWAAPETERVYLRAQELAESGGSPAQRFSLLTGLFGLFYVGGRLREARERHQQLLQFVSRHPEPPFVLETLHHDWSLALSAGELESAQRHVEDGLAFYEAQLRSVPFHSTGLIIRRYVPTSGALSSFGCAATLRLRDGTRLKVFHWPTKSEIHFRSASR
jgi:predicted ATPase